MSNSVEIVALFLQPKTEDIKILQKVYIPRAQGAASNKILINGW